MNSNTRVATLIAEIRHNPSMVPDAEGYIEALKWAMTHQPEFRLFGVRNRLNGGVVVHETEYHAIKHALAQPQRIQAVFKEDQDGPWMVLPSVQSWGVMDRDFEFTALESLDIAKRAAHKRHGRLAYRLAGGPWRIA